MPSYPAHVRTLLVFKKPEISLMVLMLVMFCVSIRIMSVIKSFSFYFHNILKDQHLDITVQSQLLYKIINKKKVNIQKQPRKKKTYQRLQGQHSLQHIERGRAECSDNESFINSFAIFPSLDHPRII